MLRKVLLSCTAALLLAACGDSTSTVGPDGKPLPGVYRISAGDTSSIQTRIVDSVNSLRQAKGVQPVTLDPQLTSAAKTHSNDMAQQNRAWHFGSDGSSPIDRVRAAGYSGQLIGETVSETYENEVETLSAWMDDPATRRIIMAPSASRMGFAWNQTDAGKIWWTLVMAN